MIDAVAALGQPFADIAGGPFVLVPVRAEKLVETLKEAAVLAACYSRAWKEGIGYVDVFWVKGSQVSKKPPSGEYLGKGAFMVYGKRSYVRGVELKLAIGVEVKEEYARVIAGEENLIASRSPHYVVLAPGDMDPGRVARRVKELLLEKSREEEKILVEAIPLEEFIEKIPGPSRIIKIV